MSLQTLDFRTLPGFQSPRALKRLACGSPFQKYSDFEIPVKSSVSYLNYYFKSEEFIPVNSSNNSSDLKSWSSLRFRIWNIT